MPPLMWLSVWPLSSCVHHTIAGVVKFICVEDLNSSRNGRAKSQKGRASRRGIRGDRELNTLEKIYSEKNEGTADVEVLWFAVRVIFFSLLE
jgi:hypothetical protein